MARRDLDVKVSAIRDVIGLYFDISSYLVHPGYKRINKRGLLPLLFGALPNGKLPTDMTAGPPLFVVSLKLSTWIILSASLNLTTQMFKRIYDRCIYVQLKMRLLCNRIFEPSFCCISSEDQNVIYTTSLFTCNMNEGSFLEVTISNGLSKMQ